jgi:hypothetical protein
LALVIKYLPCFGIMFDAKSYKEFIELDVENEQMVPEISRKKHKYMLGHTPKDFAW